MTCSDGQCGRDAELVITFVDGRKLPYCVKHAKRIGGEQRPVEAR